MEFGFTRREVETECPRDCPERSATCHATCERYLTGWRSRQEANKRKMKNGKVDEYACEMIEKTQRRGNDALSRLRRGYKKHDS